MMRFNMFGSNPKTTLEKEVADGGSRGTLESIEDVSFTSSSTS
jgi:hypothetical protein